jgi:hypothetical protein
MEIALLWLDDLDDLLFSAAHFWGGVRRFVFRCAFAAFSLFALCELALAAIHVVSL